jgi:Domain of unknown function (DUF4148)
VFKSNLPRALAVCVTVLASTAACAQEATQRSTPQKSRAQVRAETVEAVRLGLVPIGDVVMPQATAEQLEQIRLAGLRAVQLERQAARK